jgi:L-alanine-DL-glutamate epimerase-like enolase superfamily enzyme
MGDTSFMKQQIRDKLDRGFRVLKMKVGALETEREVQIVSWIRSRFGNRTLELRLDANGAWTPEEALQKMELFAPFGIHSMEQPIVPGQWGALDRICRNAPFPVALDEELIGLDPESEGARLMETVHSHYLILKPGLLGGFAVCSRWIDLAETAGTGWWITSALESAVGLGAIAQWTFQKNSPLTQGLGTGSIYRNNFSSPLTMEGSQLWYREETGWDLSPLYGRSAR